ncbi:diaminopimelate epimerase [Apibacter muscae]|uniref:Diaminopimelate epimerase n=1 Tax=Apibacter muscae TaxID=2509004 RepID=A0A563DG70_9FLAO|nr:diaminopimelate epimerase [Apibacter muscae]TWP29127.1 diaminopimelate epimerase [Apibacter muscae]TWP30292.1 diaminopimelate epimerase [Apibacter muscae]
MTINSFVKTQGLGNEYIVLDENNITFPLTEKAIQTICNVNFGIGSDGILVKTHSKKADIGLKIFNPDGSEAEKSGNGLRIFCKYVFDYKILCKKQFTVETKGGIVNATIQETHNNRASIVTVDMGKAIFSSPLIPTLFECQEVQDQNIQIEDKNFQVNCVSLGNPHCVILKENLDVDEIKKYGPLIENYSKFPNRINVQFAKIIDRKNVEILIWERGAGFTLASGSSSCAVASVLRKKGLIDHLVTIHMLGGYLTIEISEEFNIRMTGEVKQICDGTFHEELINSFV